MNIKKVIILYIIIILGLFGYIIINKDIGKEPTLSIEEGKLNVLEKDINFITFDLNQHNIHSNDYGLLETYIRSLNKSTFISIENSELTMSYIKGDSNYYKNIKNAIDSILNDFNKNKDNLTYSVVIPKYTNHLFDLILDDEFNLELENGNKLFNVIDNKNKLSILEKDLEKYFINKEDILNINRNTKIRTSKIIANGIISFFSNQIELNTSHELIYRGREFKKGFDIKENSYPILYVNFRKKPGSGILIRDFNNIKKERLFNIRDNFDDYKINKHLLIEINDDRDIAEQNQGIFNTTDIYDINEYFELFLEHRGYRLIEKKDNIIIIENDYMYTLLYFDQNKEYEYDINEINISTYVYNFDIVKSINVPPVIGIETFNQLNNKLNDNNLELLKGNTYKIIGNSILLK